MKVYPLRIDLLSTASHQEISEALVECFRQIEEGLNNLSYARFALGAYPYLNEINDINEINNLNETIKISGNLSNFSNSSSLFYPAYPAYLASRGLGELGASGGADVKGAITSLKYRLTNELPALTTIVENYIMDLSKNEIFTMFQLLIGNNAAIYVYVPGIENGINDMNKAIPIWIL